MIFDNIANLEQHNIPFKDRILFFLSRYDVLEIPLTEIEINGHDLFVRPAEYETRPCEQGKFEAHQVYADLQYVVKGEELMQGAPADGLVPITGYDAVKDYQFFKVEKGVSNHIVKAGEFAIFWPGEAHRPSCSLGGNTPSKVRKLVFKIRMK